MKLHTTIINKLLLVISFVFLISSCEKDSKIEHKINDNSVDVFSKISTQVFQMDTSQFQLLSQDQFLLKYDADVTSSDNLHAICLIEMSGTSQFLKFSSLLTLQLKLNEIQLVSFEGSNEICSRYISALKQQQRFELPLLEVNKDYILFSNLDFSTNTPDLENNFQVETNHIRISDFGIRRDNRLQEYFVKPGTTVNVTKTVVQDLNHIYSLVNDNGTQLKVNFNNRAIAFSSKPCGFSYEFNNEGSYTQAQGFGIWSVLEYATSQPSVVFISDECNRWEKNILSLSQKKLEWGAVIESGLPKALFMRFPSLNTNHDRVEIFY